MGALLAGLNVSYRDFRYTIPFLVQIWMFATPTIYMNVDALEANPPQALAAASGSGQRLSPRLPGEGQGVRAISVRPTTARAVHPCPAG